MTRTLTGPTADAANGAADALVVFLHGYGANGDDLFGLAQPLSGILPGAAFSAPNAPERTPMSPMGYQWFPIPWLDGSSEEEMRAGWARAVDDLNAYLDAELKRVGVGPDRLALVGFSQGTMMSLHVGPRRDPGPLCIVGFSGRLAEGERLPAEKKSAPPVLLVHGDQDEMIPVSALDEAREGLAAAGLSVRWHVSRGVGHGIGQDGLQLAAAFLRDHLG
ncbi:MAG: dienelactone hydrolase family protein [Pseudomonadota bacterium]